MAGPPLEGRRIQGMAHRGGKMSKPMTRGIDIVLENKDSGSFSCTVHDLNPAELLNALRCLIGAVSQIIADSMVGGNESHKSQVTLAVKQLRDSSMTQFANLSADDALRMTRFEMERLHALLTVFVGRDYAERTGRV